LGLFGVAVIYAIKYPNQDGLSLKNLGLNLFLIFALGMMAHVDNMAHLGGFIAGLVMSALIILLNLSGKTKWLTQIIASVLVASIIGVYYWQHFDANMQKNIAAAQLSETLATMGFRDSSSANTFMYFTNAGIEEIVSKSATATDLAALSAESMAAMKALNIPENYVKEGAAEYQRCQDVAQHVQTFFTLPTEQLMWQQLSEYCQVHQNAFETITGDTKTVFSPKEYLEVNSKMSEMVQSEPMLNILNNINELALATVNESQCPYTSCKRFK
jgi:hypothetical protein